MDDDSVSTLDIVSAHLVPFRVVFLPDGVNSPNFQEYRGDENNGARVEFYDRRYPFTPDGQFTGGRYYVRDIIDRPEGRPLAFDVGSSIRDWIIDADAMTIVRAWLRLMTTRPPRFPAAREAAQEVYYV